MKLHNPTANTIYAFLGTAHGADPVNMQLAPGESAAVDLTSEQMINFKEVEKELKDLGLIIQ